MYIADFSARREHLDLPSPAACRDSAAQLVICRTDEVPALGQVWDLDKSTVLDCMDLDESVRFTAFDGYDFVSLVHMEAQGAEVALRELNLYVARGYLILVMPPHNSLRLSMLESQLLGLARSFLSESAFADPLEKLNQLFFQCFNTLLSDASVMLEDLEDRMQSLSERLTGADEEFQEIQALRKTAYTVKKQLRALSYMGLQILCNENDILSKKRLFLFRNLDTRLRKLCDFAESIYGLSTELLRTYDSKVTQKTNDIVNKLTVITLFFGPLTVITGIYGMNFTHMPELTHPWAYPAALGIMAAISGVIYWVLKRKKWL